MHVRTFVLALCCCAASAVAQQMPSAEMPSAEVMRVIARLLAGHDQQAQIWQLKPGREAS